MPNASAANLSQIANGADWRHSETIWGNYASQLIVDANQAITKGRKNRQI